MLEKAGWMVRQRQQNSVRAARPQQQYPFQEAVAVLPDVHLVPESSPVELDIILPGRGLSPVPGSR